MPKILKKNGNFILIVPRINASFSPFLNFVLLWNQVLSSFGCLQFDVLALIACQFGFVDFTCVRVLCACVWLAVVVGDYSLPIKEHTGG